MEPELAGEIVSAPVAAEPVDIRLDHALSTHSAAEGVNVSCVLIYQCKNEQSTRV